MAETVQEPVAPRRARKSKKKSLVIVVVVALQLVVAYVLVGFFLRHGSPDSQAQTAGAAAGAASKSTADPNFDHVYVVKDLIVNPAGTNGLRFLLTTIGLEVSSEETVKELQKRDMQVHDAIINILTSMTLPQLDDPGTRDSLKTAIKSQINSDLSTGTVLNVYFSKFIIQ